MYVCAPKCPGGGIGRRVGLKHQCLHGRAGSTPALGTKTPVNQLIFRGLFFTGHVIGQVFLRNYSFL